MIERFPRVLSITTASLLLVGSTACSSQEAKPSQTVNTEKVCEPYRVYGQNRWELHPGQGDYGAGVWDEIANDSTKHPQGIGPNQPVMVDAWVYKDPALYPGNPEGFQGEIWLRLADRSGWVNDGGTRSEPSEPDLTGISEDGGVPVELKPECEVSLVDVLDVTG